jgi:uncharacterized repeat protein (TIGR01451 family)
VPANNSATDVDTIVRPPAHLVASKTVSGTYVQGGAVTYTIVLANDGEGGQPDNPGDELADVLPAGLSLVSAAASSGTAVANLGTNTASWNGAIPARDSVTTRTRSRGRGEEPYRGDSVPRRRRSGEAQRGRIRSCALRRAAGLCACG